MHKHTQSQITHPAACTVPMSHRYSLIRVYVLDRAIIKGSTKFRPHRSLQGLVDTHTHIHEVLSAVSQIMIDEAGIRVTL